MFQTHKWLLLSLCSFLLLFFTLAKFIVTDNLQTTNNTYYNISDAPHHNFTTILLKQRFTNNTFKKTQELLAKMKIETKFKAQTNYLGIIAIPFNAYNKSIHDKVVFRIKESGKNNWYFQSVYDTAQFQTDVPFPFGFPTISNSKNKSYTFEIESLYGKPGNALSLSKVSPVFISEYKFSKSSLTRNPYELLQFIGAKMSEQLSHLMFTQLIILFVSVLIPFLLYLLYIAAVKQPRIYNVILSALLIVIIINLFLISLAEIGYPYQRDPRDGALIDIAHQFVIGSNPYTISNSLPHTYTYGFVAPLIDAVLSKIFSFNLGITQHLITFACMLLIGLIVAKEIFKTTKNIPLMLMSLVVVLIYNNVSFKPELLAILVTTYTLYFVNHTEQLNFKKILFLSLSIITLFYIKQYFIILFPVLVIYFIFNNSKKYLIYLIATTFILGVISFLIIIKLFPVYFLEAIVNHVNIPSGSWLWMMQQSIAFIQLNWVLLLLFVGSIVIGFIKNMDIHFNITHINKPLLQFPDTPLKSVYFIYSFISIVFLTMILGENGGAYLLYYFQLLPVSICIFAISYFYVQLKTYRFSKALLLLIVTLFIFENRTYLSFSIASQNRDRMTWKNSITYIGKHKPQEAYLSPIFTLEAVNKNWPIYDNGQTEYYAYNEITQKSQKYHVLSSKSQYISPRLKRWQNELNDKISNKKFSVMLLPTGWHGLVNDTYLNKYYTLKKEMELPTYALGKTEIWEPK